MIDHQSHKPAVYFRVHMRVREGGGGKEEKCICSLMPGFNSRARFCVTLMKQQLSHDKS